MTQHARILPERYAPEATDDERPEINGDGSPQSPRDYLLPPESRAMIEDQESLREARSAMSEAHRTIYQRHVDKKNASAAVLGHLSRDTTATDAHLAKAEKDHAKDVKAAKAVLVKQKTESGNLPADSMSVIDPFVAAMTRISNGKGFVFVGTDEPLLPGMDEEESAAPIADEIREGRAELGAIDSAPMHTGEFTEQTRKRMEKLAAQAVSNIRAAAKTFWDPGRFDFYIPGGKAQGRYDNLGVEIPKVAYVVGTGDLRYLNDGAALQLATNLDGVVNSIVAQAAGNHSPEGLTMAERTAQRLEVEEHLLELERRHESLRRKALAKGKHFPRISSNPFAILDVAIKK